MNLSSNLFEEIMLFEADIKDIIRNYKLSDEEGFLYCLYEAISNSLYSSLKNDIINIEINIKREIKTNTILKHEDIFIDSFSICDNGIGFCDENYENFVRKIYKTNHDCVKGLGRVSFLKIFNNVFIDSYFKESKIICHRSFEFNNNEIVIDNKSFLTNNSEEKPKTIITFKNLKEEFREYTKKDIEYYYKSILKHFYIFFYYLCSNNKIFNIKFIDDAGEIKEKIIDNEKIKKDIVDISKFELEEINFKIPFEVLHIKTKNIGSNNAFYVVDERSAGEIKNLDLPIGILKDKNELKYNYQIYLKSDYFNKFLNDSRTELTLPKKQNSSKNLITEEIIEHKVKDVVENFLKYELAELKKSKEEKIISILNEEKNNIVFNNSNYTYIFDNENIKNEFLKTINNNSTEKEIIKNIKIFHEELKYRTINKINELGEKLKDNKEIDFKTLNEDMQNLFEQANMRNSVELSSYIMYRKYILELFHNALTSYKDGNKQNEAFFHNLLLKKRNINNIDSNLWLIDDSFLYFDGISEVSIQDIKINGKKIIKELNKDEEKELNEFNKRRLTDKVDLLFFPEEKECIIIELKSPNVGLGENAFQVDRYARLIANFTLKEFRPIKFYTYLITDNFNKFDDPGNGYIKMYGIDGFVRRSSEIRSFTNNEKIAEQYSEIVKYTDIYKRAKRRNEIFFKKLKLN